MEYLVYVLIAPWLVYTLYEDWKDAHRTSPHLGKGYGARKKSENRKYLSSESGRSLLILGVVAIWP